MVHAFDTSLRWSEEFTNAPWWETVYRQAFPEFASMAAAERNTWGQKSGIDRVITLSSGKTVTVDEKVRRKDWGDFCLEIWSDEARKVAGWLTKGQATDYLAYAFVDTRRCFLLPFLSLQRAFRERQAHWIALAEWDADGYRMVRADNGRYTTVSVAVPIKEVLTAIASSSVIRW